MIKTCLLHQDVYLVTFSKGEILAVCKDLIRLYEKNKKYLSQDSIRFINACVIDKDFAENFYGNDAEVGGKV